MKIISNLISSKVSSNTLEAYKLFDSRKFGEKIGEKIFYSTPEALFLVEENKMEIYDSKNKKLEERELTKKFEKTDKRFLEKYLVFKDLRKKGYLLKTALKFGADFRVYEKVYKSGKKHSEWLLITTSEDSKIKWSDITAKARVANSVNKKLIISIVDEEGSISYYETNWKKI